MRKVVCVVITATLFLGACTEDAQRDSGSADTTATTTSAAGTGRGGTDTTQSGAATDADTLEWTSAPIDVDRSISQIAVVDELRTGRHQDYDRVVVEFQNDVIPGYQVSYLDEQPIECGSGETINIAGNATLELRLEPARGHNEQGQSTVDHAARQFELPILQEAEVSCDFEGMFTVLLGLQERAQYRVSELQNPCRLVVDLRHSSNQ